MAEEFGLRWDNFKSSDHKYQTLELFIQHYLFEHFNSQGHYCFLDEISTTFIDKADSSELLKRKIYRRSILKTIAP